MRCPVTFGKEKAAAGGQVPADGRSRERLRHMFTF